MRRLYRGFAVKCWGRCQFNFAEEQNIRTGCYHCQKRHQREIINDDIFLHHAFIDSPNMKFDSESQKKGTIVEIAFKERGIYNVLCAIHPKMKLEVTVE